jgi:hypothetical protein
MAASSRRLIAETKKWIYGLGQNRALPQHSADKALVGIWSKMDLRAAEGAVKEKNPGRV